MELLQELNELLAHANYLELFLAQIKHSMYINGYYEYNASIMQNVMYKRVKVIKRIF